MRTRIIGTIAAAVAIGLLAACGPDDTGTTSPDTPSAGQNTGRAADGKDGNAKAGVPNFVGMGLQSAQDGAQAAGFYTLTSHDSLGRDRMQILDRDWKVCSQNVKAGSKQATDTKLDFGAVKLDETCPAKDQAPPSAADGTMPDFRGKSVKAARGALDSGTSITVTDAGADDRMVLLESNWQVCTQSPAGGAKLSGQPVTFTAVKFGESCP
ncbi:hypothetical protein ACFV5G_36325 [Streptomyces sp. NPDC059766]|uniref:hypothetical protein n=1 Tax=Streptomyces sp. NPDC059766 TaxID=3346940 RepID=UPI00365DC21E